MSSKEVTLTCKQCSSPFIHNNRRRRYCSKKCEYKSYNDRRSPNAGKTERICKQCCKPFKLETKGDNSRKYCGSICAKRSYTKQQSTWRFKHYDKELMREYRQSQLRKNPNVDRVRNGIQRELSIKALGGKCVVGDCVVTKLVWLHIDFIPTTVGIKYRHPRHWAYIRSHLNEFRLLCANHHYELTLTGKIEGTNITQPRHTPKRRAY